MMRLELEQKSKEEVLIFGIDITGERKEIGRIFTPAGSGGSYINSIQICGFDHAYNYWGCGVYGDNATGKMKKDIQLNWFRSYDKMSQENIRKVKVGEKEISSATTNKKYIQDIMKDRFSTTEKDGVCSKCFNYPCTCEVSIMYDNPYLVKRPQDLPLYTKKDFDEAVKYAVLNSLKSKS